MRTERAPLPSTAIHFLGIATSVVGLAFTFGDPWRTWNERLVWYSGVPPAVFAGFGWLGAKRAAILAGREMWGRMTAVVVRANTPGTHGAVLGFSDQRP